MADSLIVWLQHILFRILMFRIGMRISESLPLSDVLLFFLSLSLLLFGGEKSVNLEGEKVEWEVEKNPEKSVKRKSGNVFAFILSTKSFQS